MIDYITDFHNTFQVSLTLFIMLLSLTDLLGLQLPIWVTEWACQDFTDANQQCNAADVSSYMNITQSFMEKTDW